MSKLKIKTVSVYEKYADKCSAVICTKKHVYAVLFEKGYLSLVVLDIDDTPRLIDLKYGSVDSWKLMIADVLIQSHIPEDIDARHAVFIHQYNHKDLNPLSFWSDELLWFMQHENRSLRTYIELEDDSCAILGGNATILIGKFESSFYAFDRDLFVYSKARGYKPLLGDYITRDAGEIYVAEHEIFKPKQGMEKLIDKLDNMF